MFDMTAVASAMTLFLASTAPAKARLLDFDLVCGPLDLVSSTVSSRNGGTDSAGLLSRAIVTVPCGGR